MQDILNILFWAGTTAGGLLILLLLMSIFSGLEIGGDIDVETGGDVDTDGGNDAASEGIGVVKSVLTFVSVGSFTARAIFLNSAWSWPLVILTSILAGIVAVFILTWFFRWLLRNQEDGTWHLWQAEGKMATVYVPIPPNGKGRIMVKINQVKREISARSEQDRTLGTREKVMITKAKDDYVLVAPVSAKN